MNAFVTVYQRRHARIAVLAGLIAALFGVLIAGLARRQLWEKPAYDEMEQRQILRRVLQPGPRGDILDRNGRLLVGNRARYSVVLYVNELRDEFRREFLRLRDNWLASRGDDTSEARRTTNSDALQRQARLNVALRYLNQANAILGRPAKMDDQALKAFADDFENHFQQNLALPFILINDIDITEYARFNEQMPVVSPMQTYAAAARYYPYGSLAAHALGYVGIDDEAPAPGDDLPGDNLRTFDIPGKAGREGIEQYHNAQLRGVTGGEIWIVDPGGFLYQRVQSRTPTPGHSLRTSLDLDLQRAADDALGDKTGAVVALDVRTGEVLAMASHPDYDLNDMIDYATRSATAYANDQNGAWLNRATEGLYPPGSTFKLVVTCAGLRAGILDGNTTQNCGPTLLIGKRAFKEDNDLGYGVVNLVKAIQVSSDVFFYQQGINIGPDRIAAEARRFGLDQPTHIDLEETHAMKVPDPLWKQIHHPFGESIWTDGDTAMMAIGQSYLLVTPLQMACLVASIARDQTRTSPTLLYDPGRDPAEVNAGGQPLGLTPAERQLLLDGMERVVTLGTGRLVRVPGVRVAGKTGTAQVVVKGNDNFTIAWFVCFAPIDDPRIAVAVAVEGTDPHDNYHGGTIAGPIAAAVLNTYFRLHPQTAAK
ncbi:MAG: penicillin-binding transpeptidase domain-containing protein [Opitutales bacterium]